MATREQDKINLVPPFSRRLSDLSGTALCQHSVLADCTQIYWLEGNLASHSLIFIRSVCFVSWRFFKCWHCASTIFRGDPTSYLAAGHSLRMRKDDSPPRFSARAAGLDRTFCYREKRYYFQFPRPSPTPHELVETLGHILWKPGVLLGWPFGVVISSSSSAASGWRSEK